MPFQQSPFEDISPDRNGVWRTGFLHLLSTCLLIVASEASHGWPFTIIDSEAPPSGRGEIFLTFDDGPHPQITPQILTVLEETDTPATFFFIGSKVAKYPELAARALLTGHQLATHGWAGDWPVLWESEAAVREIDKARQAIMWATGEEMARPTLHRPERGLVTPAISALQQACLIRIGHITFYADDASASPADADRVLEALQNGVLRHNGAAVVLHSSRYRSDAEEDDAIDKSWLPLVIKRFIDWASKQGYRFAIHPGLSGENCKGLLQ